MIATAIVILLGFLTLIYIGVQGAKWADNIAGQADARSAEAIKILQQ